ncbi:serine/threonine-protein phosphatase 4 regulatory subunit 2 isoform X1 [Iris pallida]|uniref:Serine/threonine-protein phosphatase 4 regulatory subunit 2 isoform X1 n=1 Tax=Iris pallida TaxID=29817 RepID=A0AAX6DQQ5_IRIPA|nr:serine/threonine-protein phosphatase 4 regulatory subunit 2 isoform X1 [Iris pallida]
MRERERGLSVSVRRCAARRFTDVVGSPTSPLPISFQSRCTYCCFLENDRHGLQLFVQQERSPAAMTSEVAAEEAQQPASLPAGDVDPQPEEMVSDLSNFENAEPKFEKTSDEIRVMMEVIAATGKFWHDWNMLKSLLSIRLKQVLSEYPEAKVTSGDGPQPSSLSGETYPELVRRLDEALLSFIEGPPFTLQRLCEILLTPKSTYRNLSKLALALEKNLLVTSTLTICCDPYPTTVVQKPAETERSEELHGHADPVPNGVENMAADVDEEMVEADIDEDAPSEEADPQNIDTEMQVESVSEASERNTETSDPTPPIVTCTSEQKNTGTPQEP